MQPAYRRLDSNRLASVPVVIGQLTGLRYLYGTMGVCYGETACVFYPFSDTSCNPVCSRLDGNELTSVPAEIGQLISLLSL